jgi:DNA-directed RNA polymerase specialized sigma24 family protein
MVATCTAGSVLPHVEPARQVGLLVDAEAAFRGALTTSIAGLPVGDRNLLHFHYLRGLSVDHVAELSCTTPATTQRQLARIRERLLRDTRRGLAARIPLARPELDRLLEVARSRFDQAIRRVLR